MYAQTPFFLASSLQPSHFVQLGTPLIFHWTYLLLYFTLIFCVPPLQNFPFDEIWRAGRPLSNRCIDQPSVFDIGGVQIVG